MNHRPPWDHWGGLDLFGGAVTEKKIRQLEAQARVAWQHAHRTDATAQEVEARLREAEARCLRAYSAAAKAHAESVHSQAAVDELRGVFKHWFEDAHAGLTLQQVMTGMAADLKRCLDIADEAKDKL